MGMLDRYKKKGGFLQLLQLVETSGRTKQEQFLGLIAQENPAWEEHIRKKMITLDKILAWNAVYLSEIFSRVQPLTLASAFHGFPEEKVSVVLKAITATDLRKFQMTMQEINPTPAEKATSQMKILSETRALIAKGLLKLDKIDPDLIVVENIEEKLGDFAPSPTLQAAETQSTDKETPRSEDHVPKAESKSNNESRASAESKEETEFLRKKVNQLVNENNMLKHELSVLKNKLDQIKRIA